MGFVDRLQHGWNAFLNRDPTEAYVDTSVSYYRRPDRPRLTHGNERSIITAIYNRISLDVSAIDIKHIRLDDNNRYQEDIDSALNYCLKTEANIDQTGRQLIQDIVLSMLDEGVVAVVPVDTTDDPNITGAFDVDSLRVGKILQWKSKKVQVRLYNEETGQKQDIWVSKKTTAIIENPFYAVMNEPNSTAKRLMRKLALLDVVDERTGSDRLDLIIQLPYGVKSDIQKERAGDRIKSVENQLMNSRYGIAYIDSTEKVTQLNRSLENNLLKQIKELMELLYSQLSITEDVMNGTANETTMLNYNNQTIEPIISTIVNEFRRKYLTKTARTQKQTIAFFRDPFRLVPTSQIPDLADKLTRNEIMSSNEVRQILGLKPSGDPGADELRNKNLNKQADGSDGDVSVPNGNPSVTESGDDERDALVNSFFADVESQIDSIIGNYTDGGGGTNE